MLVVEYWIDTVDGYDNCYMEVDTDDEQEAIEVVKNEHPRGKNFKIWEHQ